MEGVDTVDDVVGDILAGTIGIVTDDQTHGEGCERRGLVWGNTDRGRKMYERDIGYTAPEVRRQRKWERNMVGEAMISQEFSESDTL